MTRAHLLLASALLLISPSGAFADESLDACLTGKPMARVARYVSSTHGGVVWGAVHQIKDGAPSALVAMPGIAADAAGIRAALAGARAALEAEDAVIETIAAGELASRLCSPIEISQAQFDREELVGIGAGLNYAEHADEAGGGDPSFFPKVVAPTGAYRTAQPPDDVVLLDWEVEIGYVVLEDIDLEHPPSEDELLDRVAFFNANDLSDRAPILEKLDLFDLPASSGFVKAKSRRGFLPAGPWLVAGRELFRAAKACGETALGLRLAIDEGNGPVERQRADTSLMIIPPAAILATVGEWALAGNERPAMEIDRGEGLRSYPLAVKRAGRWILPAGSIVVTGTPGGVGLDMGNVLSAAWRGALRLRSPVEQLEIDTRDRNAAGELGGYLAAGDIISATVDGLGSQRFRIGSASDPAEPTVCQAP